MASSEKEKERISTVIKGDNNTVQNIVNITYVDMASSGERKQADSSETSSSFPGASNLSSCSGGDMPELITDSSKCDADVRETEIAWLAKEVANNGRLCDKREGLYRRLDIKDQDTTKIKQERLDKRCTIEDEIFKVINIGWLQQTGVKTRNRLFEHLSTFSKQLAAAYAGFINSCDNFDFGLPLPTPMNNISSYLSMLPSIQGTSSLQSLQNAPDLVSTPLSTLSIQGPSSSDGGQLVPSQPEPSDADGGQGDPNSIFASLLGGCVEEREVVWLSEEVARKYPWDRNSLYRHLTILDSEVDRIKYEKLGEDRNIDNEVFKVVNEGWREQDLDRTRFLLFKQLSTFKPTLAERYLKYVSGQL